MAGGCRNVSGVVAGGVAAIVVGSALATLFSIITATALPSPGKSCARKCEDRDTRICSFTFNVHLYQTLARACGSCPGNSSHCSLPHCIAGDGVRRLITVVDRQLPGPAIHVCEGDQIQVDVHNELPSSGVSLHWHGLSPSPYMDGSPGLTQALIAPRQVFQYRLTASRPGTHYWHALSGFQGGDGVFGPLVVRQSRSSEPHGSLYDHDLPEHVIMVHDWLHLPTAEKFTLHHHSGADHFPDNILVNGKGQYTGASSTPDSRSAPLAEFTVKEGERYRLRLVSAAFMNCPIVFSVARHRLTVIAADGAAILPYNATAIVLHPGERWDVVLTADQPPASYWMEFEGQLDCRANDASQRAVLRYAARGARALQGAGAAAAQPLESVYNSADQQVNPVSGVCSQSAVCLLSLRAAAPLSPPLPEPGTVLYLTFSLRSLDNPHYYHDQLYSIRDESADSRVASPQINNLTFRALPAPLLLSPPSEEAVCSDGRWGRGGGHCQHALCECVHLQQVALGQVVELVLVDAGGSSNQGQTVHLHGHSFHVLGQDVLPPAPGGLQRAQVMALDREGQLQRNLEQPVVKDTVLVPRGGYTIVRFRADNPGYWLLQSQILFHRSAGMSMVLQVGETSDLPAPPTGTPLCVA